MPQDIFAPSQIVYLDGSPLATTTSYPAGFDCAAISRELASQGWDTSGPSPWTNYADFESHGVHASAVTLLEGSVPVGFVVLLHDSALLRQLQAQSRKIAWLGFAALAVGTWVVTLVATRLSRRDWADELRRLLQTGESRADYQPVLEDVRQLAQELASEIQREGGQPDLDGAAAPRHARHSCTATHAAGCRRATSRTRCRTASRSRRTCWATCGRSSGTTSTTCWSPTMAWPTSTSTRRWPGRNTIPSG